MLSVEVCVTVDSSGEDPDPVMIGLPDPDPTSNGEYSNNLTKIEINNKFNIRGNII